ncbi:MAG: glycoside hydrolase N-terminal domain-containing protein [Oscillospiraceae bacterium]|nr:glycoside hydrolase N-terminal domain-containing protein [Oscillospiraceae bacterium]
MDLGAVSDINQVKLYWMDDNYATQYDVQISNDAAGWTTVGSKTGGAGGAETIDFAVKQARYVRLLCRVSSGSCFTLSEMEVYGTNNLSYTLPPNPGEAADGTLPITGGNWKLQRASEISADGTILSAGGYNDSSWLPAAVPGTVLNAFIKAGAVPDPNVGDQQLQISDSFFTADFWYRNAFTIPASKAGQKIWLNFEAINWKADVYFNGQSLGKIEGGFIRGKFDVTAYANVGAANYLAVYIRKNATPGAVTEQTKLVKPDGNGGADKNGGVLGYDNPTIHASVGWDWVPTIRGRNIGIYGDVFLSYTRNVALLDPYTTIDFNNANINAAKTTVSTSTVTVKGILHSTAAASQTVSVSGTIQPPSGSGSITIPATNVTVGAGAKVEFSIPVTVSNASLWWPNTYGAQPLYTANVTATVSGTVSDAKGFKFGVRKFTYENAGSASSPVLRILCNGARVMGRGGNWGMDDSNLAATPADYDVKVRLHAEANFTMIRNWVGMTNNKAFYDACDKYGIMVFDDFWLANPGDHGGTGGPQNAPADMDMFEANARDKIQKLRGRAAIAIWCGRNEGMPPDRLNAFFKSIVSAPGQYTQYPAGGSLDNTRWYVPHSADNANMAEQAGISGWGPYGLQDPTGYFNRNANKLHSELGLPNIPTYESMKEMLTPAHEWPMDNVWGLHDYCDGSAQRADDWDRKMNTWYGVPTGLRDFTRKSQMMNYENHKAIFENDSDDRSGGTLMWMSQSAWPSMVWQTYDYYYDVNGGYFGIKKGNQPINAYWVSGSNRVMLCNNTLLAASSLKVDMTIYDMSGKLLQTATKTVSANPDTTQQVHTLPSLPDATDIRYIKLEVFDSASKLISENFYWYNARTYMAFQALDTLPKVRVDLAASALPDKNGNKCFSVTLTNNTAAPALMVHLRTVDSAGERMLPVYYSDNYVSLMPGESKTVTAEIDSRFSSGTPSFTYDAWNSEDDGGAPVVTVPERGSWSDRYPTRYDQWEEGLLTGNGTQGAIVFGNPLNETTVFTHRLYNNAATIANPKRTMNNMVTQSYTYNGVLYTNLAESIKNACFNEQWQIANNLANRNGWRDGGEGSVHPGYKMNISIPSSGTVTNYSRSNDYTTAEVLVNWTDARGDWERKTFVSRKDDVIVTQLTKPSGGEKINCAISIGTESGMGLWAGQPQNNALTAGSTTEAWLNYRSFYPGTGNKSGYEGVSRVVATGGTLSFSGSILNVSNADSVIILTQQKKYYSPDHYKFEPQDHFNPTTKAWQKWNGTDDCAAMWNKGGIKAYLQTLSTDYNTLLAGQKTTHGEIYNRVALDLNAPEAERKLSNETLLALQKISSKPILALYERLFNAGRYHYLCSSGDMGGPSLIGIWAGDCGAGWGGTYHLDVNYNVQVTQGIIGNMMETMEGYFFLNESWADGFKENAELLLGTRGLLAGGNCPNWTSGLISTITSFDYPYQYVTGEMGWLLQPFWEYYEVTGDKQFLEDRLYPLLREMGDFYEDFLTLKDANGKYVFAGSISPECGAKGFSLLNNSSMDIAGAKFCLEKLMLVHDMLNKNDPKYAVWKDRFDKLPPYLTDRNGGLSEWSWPSLQNEEQYGHRHASHLLATYFLREITPHTGDPALYQAARKAVELKNSRDLGLNGHGLVHTAMVSATLKYPEGVMNRLRQVSNSYMFYTNLTTRHGGDRNYGLNDPAGYGDGIFCTDTGNAWPAIVMESLLYSDENLIELLPTLPVEFQTGGITGLLARGGYEVSMKWKNTVLQDAEITSLNGNTLTLCHDNFQQVKVTDKANPGGEIAYTRIDKDTIRFDTQKGHTYLIGGMRQDIPTADPRTFLRANVNNLYSQPVLDATTPPDDMNLKGAFIESFTDGSFGQALGMKANDIITAVNGYLVTDTARLLEVYGAIADGTEIVLKVWRQNRYIEIKFTKGPGNSGISMPGTIQAETFDEKKGAILDIQNCSDGTGTPYNIGNIANGDWVCYKNVYFGSNALSTVTFRAAKDAGTSVITVRLDDPAAGPVIAAATVQGKVSWHTYDDVIANISNASITPGVHDIYLVFNASVNINWFSMNAAGNPAEKPWTAAAFAPGLERPNGSVSLLDKGWLDLEIQKDEKEFTEAVLGSKEPAKVAAYRAALLAAKNCSAAASGYSQAQINTLERALFDAANALRGAASILLGDVNRNDRVDIGDARLILQHLVDKITLDAGQLVLADVNRDSKVTISDARLVLQYIVEKITVFPDLSQ